MHNKSHILITRFQRKQTSWLVRFMTSTEHASSSLPVQQSTLHACLFTSRFLSVLAKSSMGKSHQLHKIDKKECFQRINYLYQAAHHVLSVSPQNVELVRFYLHSLKTMAQRQVLRLDPEIKRSICKKCCMLLVPGVSATVRSRSRREKHTVVTCLECRCTFRFLWRPGHKLWCEHPEAWAHQTQNQNTGRIAGDSNLEAANPATPGKHALEEKCPQVEGAENGNSLCQPDTIHEGGEADSQVKTTEVDTTDKGGGTTAESVTETVDFKVFYKKQKFDVTFPLDNTISSLKDHIQTLTSVPAAMQKIMYKGLAKDECTLRNLNVLKNSKLLVVGSTINDVMSVSAPTTQEVQEEAKASGSTREPYSLQKQHKKVLDKYGKPDDVLPGIKGVKQPLPQQPISGMYNKAGGKVRLTFKLELDQLWIGTKDRTDKIPMNSIKEVVSEKLDGHEEYHMLGIQLGPTDASRYWIYWVPAQYVDSIKDSILGKFQYF